MINLEWSIISCKKNLPNIQSSGILLHFTFHLLYGEWVSKIRLLTMRCRWDNFVHILIWASIMVAVVAWSASSMVSAISLFEFNNYSNHQEFYCTLLFIQYTESESLS